VIEKGPGPEGGAGPFLAPEPREANAQAAIKAQAKRGDTVTIREI
jgi:hypothetical protein